MENQQNIWMMQFGVVPIPKAWYKNRSDAEEIKAGKKAMRVRSHTCIKKAVRRLQKGIYVLLKNPYIKTRDEIFNILKERDFLPVLTHPSHPDRHMSKTRFYFYYMHVTRECDIKKRRETKKDFIIANYKTMSISAMAEHIGSKEIYVTQQINIYKKDFAR